MSEKSRKNVNSSVSSTDKAAGKNLIKLDFSELQSVITDLHKQNQFLKDRISQVEMSLNRDEIIHSMQTQIDIVSEQNSKTVVSMGNIQAKIIEIEREFLKQDQRAKGFEMEMKVARNAEK